MTFLRRMLAATNARPVTRIQHGSTTMLSLSAAPICHWSLTGMTPAPILLLPQLLKVGTQESTIAKLLSHSVALPMCLLFFRRRQHERLTLAMVSANRLLRRNGQRSGAVPRMSLHTLKPTALWANLPDEVTISTTRAFRVAATTDPLRVTTRKHGHFSHVPEPKTTKAH